MKAVCVIHGDNDDSGLQCSFNVPFPISKESISKSFPFEGKHESLYKVYMIILLRLV